MSKIAYRPDIDGLRALAVLSVLFYHAGFSFLPGGFMGVDIFFVISGYLITSFIMKDLREGTFSMPAFWERRARRILPPLFVVVFITWIAGWFLLLPQDLIQLGKETASQSIFSSNILFAKQGGYFDTSADLKPLLHTWSLAVEEQFYVFFPIGMFLIYRLLHVSLRPVLWIAALGSFFISVWFVDHYQRYTFFLLPFRGWELLCGALIATRGFPEIKNNVAAQIVTVIGFACMMIAILFYTDKIVFPGYMALLPVLGATLFIWGNTGHTTLIGRGFSYAPVVFIGLISYSLYLWHWPIMVLAKYTNLPFGYDGIVISLVCCIAPVMLAFLSWRFVEQPVRQRKIFTSRRSIFVFSLIGLMLMAAAGLLTVENEGFPQRFSAATLSYAASGSDINPRRGQCDGPSIERIKEGNVCETNAKAGAPSFAIWGDSHGDAIAPLFDVLSKQYNRNGYVLTSSGCKPVLGIESANHSFNFDCENKNNEVMALLKRKKIKTLFLIGYWNDLPTDGENPGSDKRLASMAATLDKLQKNGMKIYILVNVPVSEIDPHRVLALQEYFSIKGKYALSEEKYREDIKEGLQLFRDQYPQSGAVQYLDPSVILCDDNACLTEKNGRSLYYNATHLSAYGALQLKPLFEPFFKNMR